MGLLGRSRSVRTVRGRARVVPTSTGNHGEGNVNNLSAKAAAKCSMLLVALAADDGGPVPTEAQRVIARLPNWLRHVMHDAGSNHGAWADLPAEIDVPVLIDAAERTIVAMDVEGAIVELEALRAIGTREYREHDAPLAPVRTALKLPGLAVRETKDLIATWGKAIGTLRQPDGADEPLDAEELEQRRRTAAVLRVQFERNPKQREQVRRSALTAGPMMASGVRAGTYPSHEFEAWVVFQETSGVITAGEAAAFRATARPED